MNHYPAVGGTNEVVVVVDNKIVGSAWIHSSARGRVIVGMEPTMFDTILKDDDVYLTMLRAARMPDAECRKWATFAFSEYTGEYVGTYVDEAENRGEGMRIVSKFHLHFGMVPDSFKDVEGYRSAIKEFDRG